MTKYETLLYLTKRLIEGTSLNEVMLPKEEKLLLAVYFKLLKTSSKPTDNEFLEAERRYFEKQ